MKIIKSTLFLLTVILGFFSASFTMAPNLMAAEPNIQTIAISAVQGSCNEIDLSFIPGDGSRRIIIAREDNPVSSFPVDNVGYSSSSLFGTGSDLGGGNYVIYNSTGNSMTVTGLSGGHEYFFAVFEFNGFGNNANYLLTNYPQASAIASGFTMSVSSSSGDMCKGDTVRFEVHGAETYSWSPSGSLSSSTDSIVWAHPNNSTTYTVTGGDHNGCSDQKTITITVYNLPNVTLGSFSSRCENAGSITLNSGSPNGGVYSGPGVSGTHFNPATAGVGSHTIKYTYSDIHGCSNFATSAITVLSKPNAQLAAFNDVCINDSAFALTGGTPVGGIYVGPGVSNGLFSPASAGAANHQIKYIYMNASGCADTTIENLRVRSLPTVIYDTAFSICINNPTLLLTGGTPAGGNYSGNGVSNSQFSPLVTGAGTFPILYTYTDSHNCSNNDTSEISVNTLPSVDFDSLNSVCDKSGPVTLTGGTPAGGIYSGTAVANGVFYSGIAGAGQHTITYSYTDFNNCTNSTTQIMSVNSLPIPQLGPDLTICSDESAILSPGIFSSYTWSTGAIYSAISVDTNGYGLGTFQFTVNVANSLGCTFRDTILVTFDGCSDVQNLEVKRNNFIVYPNPSNESFNILSEGGADISIYDLKGSLILRYKKIAPNFSFGENLEAGTYIVKTVRDQISGYKLILKN